MLGLKHLTSASVRPHRQLLALPASRLKSTSELGTVRRWQRIQKLKEIYKPFESLDRGSKEYMELARSGKVWEDWFRPGDSKLLGYLRAQQQVKALLAKIDELKSGMSVLVDAMAKTLIVEYAHQSVQIESNRVSLGDSFKIDGELNEKLFQHINLGDFSAQSLSTLEIPDTITESQESDHVAELKNHIVVSRWISEMASRAPDTSGLTELELKILSAISLRNTSSEDIYNYGWGERLSLGDYRATPISVRFDPLLIFPYAQEVPSLMQRFIAWRDEVHSLKELHPLVLACQMTAYFLHIHPFLDGNGRVGRMLMHDYMVRQGYLPTVMVKLDRTDYLEMINEAQLGRPAEFVLRVLETQMDELLTCIWRAKEST